MKHEWIYAMVADGQGYASQQLICAQCCLLYTAPALEYDLMNCSPGLLAIEAHRRAAQNCLTAYDAPQGVA